MNQPIDIQVLDTLRDAGLQYRDRGSELQLTNCPFCERDKEKPSEHFSINRTTGVYHCFKCSTKGNLVTLRRELGIDPFATKETRKPDPAQVRAYTAEVKDDYYAQMEVARGVPAVVAKKYGVGRTNHPRLGVCRTYPYCGESGEVLNVKYVTREKRMEMEKNCAKPYFGLQFLDFSKDTLHVTEGEDDALCLAGIGFDNVVSVPNGAKSYTEEMGAVNARFKRIYLFHDSDQPGEEGAEVFAHKAGVWKCWRVRLPFKDARDCKLNGLDIFDMQKYLGMATQYEYKAEDRGRPALSIDERLDRFEREVKSDCGGVTLGYAAIDGITGGLRAGDVFGIVANPECFKTTMLMNFLLDASGRFTSGMAVFFSLEMQIEAATERELQITTKQRSYDLRSWAHSNSAEWQMVRKSARSHNRLYVSEESQSTTEDIIKIVKRTEEATGEPCRLIGIDYIDFVKALKSNEYEAVKEVMNALKWQVARGLRVPVIVLAQTNRTSSEADSEVSMRSGKGGTAIESACDFMVGLWRNGEDVVGRFLKHRRIDSGYAGHPHPYLRLHIDKPNYHIQDIRYCQVKTDEPQHRGKVLPRLAFKDD